MLNSLVVPQIATDLLVYNPGLHNTKFDKAPAMDAS